MKVPFLDLSAQYHEIKKEVRGALEETMQRGDFILGKEVKLFEKEFAAYFKRRFAVGVNSGTDALFLGLLSLGIGPQDEVIVPAFTYIATSLAVSFTGAKPVFVDIDEDTYNIDVKKIRQAINKKTKAIIPVHLYGQPADMHPISALAKEYNLKVIEDTAQAHGAKYKTGANQWRLAGTFGDLGCFSFYPTKNLGAFGDGGAIVTDSEDNYNRLLKLRDYGRRSRYEHIVLGYNSRLDTLQAAILRIKLRGLQKCNQLRRSLARVYLKELKGVEGLILPSEADYARHVYHIFAIRVKNRDSLVEFLAKKDIGVLIHYPIPLHLQEVYKNLGYQRKDFPVAEKVARQILSLPMHPYLKAGQIKYAAKMIKEALNNHGR